MISVRPVEAGEWRSYRDLRLQSLQDSPDAFASTYESEAGRTDEVWASRLAGAVSSGQARIFVALDHQQMCGLVWCKLPEAGVAEIFQMWVDPARRGLGAGGALLHEALEWAKSVLLTAQAAGGKVSVLGVDHGRVVVIVVAVVLLIQAQISVHFIPLKQG